MSSASRRPPLRVAMIGAGMISFKHLTAWKRLPDAQVVAIVDPTLPRAAARAREFDVPRCYETLEALLAEESIDAADIASSRESHGALLRLLIDRGIPALCEKPLVPDVSEALTLADAARERTRIMVNQNFRFRPYYERMKAWIEDGSLGALTGCSIACRSSGLLLDAAGRFPYIERQPYVRTESRLMIAEVLIHRLDVARWLCGSLALVAARARHSCPELRGESEATLLFETRSGGMPVVVDGNFACAGYPEQSVDRVEIIGTCARIEMDHNVLRLHGPRPFEERYDPDNLFQESFNRTIEHFVDCLRTGQRFRNEIDDNLETLRLVDEAYRAAADLTRHGCPPGPSKTVPSLTRQT